jgi:hypothetical protein
MPALTNDTMDTMRSKVLDALTNLFPQRDTDASNAFMAAYGVPGFSIVTREPLGSLPTGKINSLGVYGGTTEKAMRFPFYDVNLPTVIEIHCTKEDNVAIAKTVERYLGIIEKVVKLNEGLGGLTSTIEITGDNVNIDSPYGQQADGALYMDVKFSQQVEDPTLGRQ